MAGGQQGGRILRETGPDQLANAEGAVEAVVALAGTRVADAADGIAEELMNLVLEERVHLVRYAPDVLPMAT